jgi:protocatechuate 3,4-dioxygenase beta subunit/plastocyanin
MRSICASIMATLMLAGATAAETHTVLANSTSFAPDAIDVAPGDTIVWQYNSGYPHTVTSGVPCTADGLFHGELQSGGDTFTWEVPLDASGDIPYFCEPHCAMGMTGIIEVADPLCALTRPDVEGPYWIPGSPERSDLRDPGDGPLLDLNLSVIDQDCVPVSGAWIDIWHADPYGDYDKNGWGYRGHHFADGAGHSLLETVIPGLYPGRTRHIHVKVRGATPATFTTQLYFPDVPENDDDFFYHPDLEVTVLDEDADGNMIVEFQFVIEDTNTCPADLDGDGVVGVDEILAVIAAWNTDDADADVNDDGIVDVTDLLIVIDAWGPCP